MIPFVECFCNVKILQLENRLVVIGVREGVGCTQDRSGYGYKRET